MACCAETGLIPEIAGVNFAGASDNSGGLVRKNRAKQHKFGSRNKGSKKFPQNDTHERVAVNAFFGG